LPEPATASLYTVTSGSETPPAAWKLEASVDGATWTVLDERSDQVFPWARQLRPFVIPNPGEYQHYRLTFSGRAGLAQVELLR
jgi:hypothetical protein